MHVRVLVFFALFLSISVAEENGIADAELHAEHIKSSLSKVR